MSDQGYEPTQVGQSVAGPPTQVGYGGPPTYGGQPPGPGGFPPPPDRRPWIIGGLVAAILVVIVAIVLLSGGDDGDDDDVASDGSTTSSIATTSSSTTSSSSTSSTSSTTSSTSSTTTTAPPETTTTTSPPVTIPPNICSAAGDNEGFPDPAAEAVYGAWTRGDEECARVLMTNAAFNRLFQNSGAGATFTFQGCGDSDNPEVDQDCGFLTEGTAMHFLMIFSADEGWLVTDVIQNAD